MRLSTRMSLTVIALVVLALAWIGYVAYRELQELTLRAELQRLQQQSALLGLQFSASISDGSEDVLAISTLPSVQTLTTGLANSESVPELEARRRSVEQDFLSFISNKPHYLQIRFLDAGPEGLEVVRVERTENQGPVSVTNREDLQPKGERLYLQTALDLAEGQFSVSPIDLNREFGEIVEPYVPVIRISTPVFANGVIAGVIVVNIDLREPMSRLRSASSQGIQFYLVNSSGDYLVSPDRSQEFGFDLGRPQRLGDTFPDIGAEGGLEAPGAYSETLDADGRKWVAAWTPFDIDGGNWHAVVGLQRLSQVSALINSGLSSATLAMLMSFAVIAVAAVLFARQVARPVAEFADTIVQYDQGHSGDLPKSTPQEFVDIFERFKANFQHRSLYNAIVAGSTEAIITTDKAGRITSWNPAAEALYGFSSDHADGRAIWEMLPSFRGVDTKGKTTIDLESAEGVEPRTAQSGNELEVAFARFSIRDSDGEVVGFADFSRDVAPLRLAERQFKVVFDSSPTAMLSVDREGTISLANMAAHKMFGFESDSLSGMTIESLLPDRFRDQHVDLRKNYAVEPTSRMMGKGRDLFALRSDGVAFPVEVALNPYQAETGPEVLCVVVDITERRNAEMERERFTAELERSNDELQRFAYVASHDLQEPLRMVISFCRLLQERYSEKLDDDGKEFIGFAVDGAQRMRQQITDLLDYSRLQTAPTRFESFPASEAVDQALASLSTAIAEANAEIDVQSLPQIEADRGQIARVFQNLIGNAIKFRGDAKLRVSISYDPVDRIFSVRDNGIGVEETQAEAIFDVFRRLHNREEYPGTGIGLAVCKRIIEQMGGRIWIESVEGGGSCFRFTLGVPSLETQ